MADERHPESYCHRCGNPNVVWFAPNDLWNRVMPDDGIVCPVCFVLAAESAGIVPTGWALLPEDRLPDPTPAAPDQAEGPQPDDIAELRALADKFERETQVFLGYRNAERADLLRRTADELARLRAREIL